ncbi:hypothetical protein Y032_0057g2750 [Ancylostoma ceylanicum]|nr:hypothetical protein Y032_0057g2750 [Ancylostoma ceylanicum]
MVFSKVLRNALCCWLRLYDLTYSEEVCKLEAQSYIRSESQHWRSEVNSRVNQPLPIRLYGLKRLSSKIQRSSYYVNKMTSHQSFIFLLLFHAFLPGIAIICYDCHSDQGTCNEGECEGVVCIKMETSNKDNGKLPHFCEFSQLLNLLPCKKEIVKNDDLRKKFFSFFGSQFSDFSAQNFVDLPIQ